MAAAQEHAGPVPRSVMSWPSPLPASKQRGSERSWGPDVAPVSTGSSTRACCRRAARWTCSGAQRRGSATRWSASPPASRAASSSASRATRRWSALRPTARRWPRAPWTASSRCACQCACPHVGAGARELARLGVLSPRQAMQGHGIQGALSCPRPAHSPCPAQCRPGPSIVGQSSAGAWATWHRPCPSPG